MRYEAPHGSPREQEQRTSGPFAPSWPVRGVPSKSSDNTMNETSDPIDRNQRSLETDDSRGDARRLLDAYDVAVMLGMTTDWIYREVRAGRLPHIRLGRYVRFRGESIDAWLDARERHGRIRQSSGHT